jgi:CRISPR/Cas system endoribonuclease Cas6 (RAMP superfamily)
MMSEVDHGAAGARRGEQVSAIEVHFRAGDDLVFRDAPNYLLLTACLAAIDAAPGVAPETKRRVHDERQRKSFSISPLVRVPERAPAAMQPSIPAGARLAVRVCALDSATLRAFVRAFASRRDSPLRLDHQPLHVLGWREAAPPGAPFAHGTYAELLAAARPAESIALRLASPTAFRSGDAVVPPSAVQARHFFGGYFARWKAFSPAELAPFARQDLLAAVTAIDVSGLREAPLSFAVKQPRSAWLGEVRFRIAGDAATATLLAALADFAAFCGTGSGTAMGLGQTERLVID